MKSRFLLQKLAKPSIRRRLALGYFLTIAIAATGIQIGQRWAYHRVREPAQRQLETAYDQSNHLSELQRALLDTKGLIIAYIRRPDLLENYSYHLTNRSQQLQLLINELETDYLLVNKDLVNRDRANRDRAQSSPVLMIQTPNQASSAQAIPEEDELTTFIDLCKDAGTDYEQALITLFANIESTRTGNQIEAIAAVNPQTAIASLDDSISTAILDEITQNETSQLPTTAALKETTVQNDETDIIRNQLLSFLQLEPAERLNRCALALEALTFRNQSDILKASFQLERATQLQSRITNLTLLLSLVGAIAIALYSSWSITRPLTNVSRVAQQVSQNSNFDVQVPVETNDEVGVLAASLNNLIHRVRLLLREQKEAQEQLETYNQTLESAVETRSQEILEKNARLEKIVEDLHEAQSQLVQAEKMSSLGQLVAGIAHEINNPVNFIHGNLQHTEAYFQDLLSIAELSQTSGVSLQEIQDRAEEIELDFLSEDIEKLVNSMKIGTERIREIVLSLRNFSRLDESDLKTANLHEGLDSTLLILGHRFKGTAEQPEIEIIKRYGNIPPIDCFPGQLNQVFMNILANAVDAFEKTKIPNPQITISTAHSQNQVSVVIADNGSGIPENVRQRIFEPFFTTKDVGKGTGMGLSISYKIITERHQGHIDCESSEGKGTAFTITLPTKRESSLT